jgi:hypothetical protein
LLRCEISTRHAAASGQLRLSRPAGRKATNVGCFRDSGGTVHGRLFVGQCHKPTLRFVIELLRQYATE